MKNEQQKHNEWIITLTIAIPDPLHTPLAATFLPFIPYHATPPQTTIHWQAKRYIWNRAICNYTYEAVSSVTNCMPKISVSKIMATFSVTKRQNLWPDFMLFARLQFFVKIWFSFWHMLHTELWCGMLTELRQQCLSNHLFMNNTQFNRSKQKINGKILIRIHLLYHHQTC